ncbi:MAG: GIY-YIG nuclease family protein [Betaproteobacteria bacterium]|nr:MAG: GIY-YIG nuclease family protein [Betaproteobacteria bacterium]
MSVDVGLHMPKQSLLRLIKRWKRYEPRKNRTRVQKNTRGVYVLYNNRSTTNHEVIYIGVAGLGKTGGGGIQSRLRTHDRRIKNRTHYSFFEVHDNITSEEIRELEALLLGIFRDDPRIELANKQKGSRKLRLLRKATHWIEAQPSVAADRPQTAGH